MGCESSHRPRLRAVLPALQRRPHVTRRSTQGQGQGQGRSRAAASWSSMSESRAQAQAVSDKFVSGMLRPKCYYGDEMPGRLPPVPSASFEIVSAMPECLQETSLDLPAWVENTNHHTLQLGGGAVDEELVPWMQMPQPELFSGISKEKYRETPLYSEAGSPDLSRAYFTDEVACPQPRPPIVSWASWTTFGLGDNYADFETLISPKRGSSSHCEAGDDNSNYGDASGEDGASISSRRGSALSIKCQGHNIPELAPTTFGQSVTQQVEESVVPISMSSEFMDWAGDWSSGQSSPCYSERAYEEFATPLAPARARIVHISGDSSQFSTRSTSLFQRDSSEYSPARISMDEVATPARHPASPDTPDSTPKSRSRPFTPYPHNNISIHTPPLTPTYLLPPPTRLPPAPPFAPTPPLNIHRPHPAFLHQRKRIWGSNTTELSSEILNDIYTATRLSSIKKLHLAHPCVVIIRNARRRWRTYDGLYINPSAASLGGLDSLSTSMFLSSGDQSPVPPSSRPSSFPPSEVGSKDTESEAVWSQGLVTRTATPVTDLETEAGDVGDAEGRLLPDADFGVLRRIFPGSDAKWYGVLYAHIVCYNYVMDLEQGPSFQHLEMEGGERGGREEEDESVRCGLIMRNLEYCISRIICRMRGKNGRRADKEAGGELRESHLVLTRSLSTFIRSCEASIM
ncbi:hypothetical protein VE02_08537 [Pseudogymnoascus sp. 03VT05]|nr:hypothetical protein VE02_08537 [Pseudogymnoascus sp. 03VT05]